MIDQIKEIITEAWFNASENGDESELKALSHEELASDMFDRLWFPFEVEFETFQPLVKEFVNGGYKFHPVLH